MPGRRESLDLTFEELEARSITRVVSLAPASEIEQKSPSYATAIEGGSLPCQLSFFPIPDFGVPADPAEFAAFSHQTAAAIQTGAKILVHCGAGIGRTGTFAAAILMHMGMSRDEALNRVKAAGSGPESEEQRRLLESLAHTLSSRQPGSSSSPSGT